MSPHTPEGGSLLSGFSLEMTGKDVEALHAAQDVLPAGTRVNVTFLGNEDLPMRLAAASAVKSAGLVPVPHISARRLGSTAELEKFLGTLADAGAVEDLFVVGGDPAEPMGPYEDSLGVIRSGLPAAYGARHISIAGYPEGHPDISSGTLWTALLAKAEALQEQGLEASIITQFGFDTAPVLAWLEELRDRGVTIPVRIGVPGPAGIKRLLGYARRFGVGTSAGIAQKYGFSLTNLLGTAGPDRFLRDLAGTYDPARHGTVQLHFYTFGGLRATAEWVRDFQEH
ncbi:methylenetetrahydrofolate reductase [Arthrobacter sp. Sa2BUA2]|uniref:Methylenetetrahydrofolate reductase n=1 Tax=Arthrobacter pullicola TaxID=2762224 RepID=A0ABR8YGC7_9MICC|nr:methylenetetrahydrofolate reductase [Arthrobacter pullicola]MBD8043281.1 methylenetetrahydrofolate reductase [Arthrobacter pullicola]